MKKQMLYGLGLALAAPLGAQGWLYSPTDLDTKTEGPYYCYYFAGYKNARQQYGDGENSGKAAVITAFNVRLDYRSHSSTSTAAGRKWTNVTVSIGEGSVDTFTNTFSSNFTTTPQVVFNAAWSLPTVSGYPLSSPAPYGGTKGEYRVPFSTAWVYPGKSDIVHDWTFLGGTLDNNVTWSTSSRRSYYFDGFSSANEYGAISGSGQYIPSTRLNNNSTGVTGLCNDSAHTTTTGSYCYLYGAAYGEKYPVDNYRGRLYFYHYSYYTGFENPVIHGIAFANDTTGADLGTGCNKLHLKGPVLLIPRVTMPSSYSTSGYSGYEFRLLKWKKVFSSLKLTVQAAWADSKTNAFNLSQAIEYTLPSGLPGPAPKRISTYYYSNPSNTTGFGPYPYYYMNPATGWETK